MERVSKVVGTWTGGYADALRQAFRMTNEAFAEHLGVAVRTVAYWRKRTASIPQQAIQEALDAALERAPDQVKARFSMFTAQERASHAEVDNGLTPDDQSRLREVRRRPSRLDAASIESLASVLANQRRVEDTIGPAAVIQPMAAQMNSLTRILREASGPWHAELGRLLAEWTSYVGWLHTAIRDDAAAAKLFNRAEELADDVGDGSIAATAASFRGYLARLQGNPRKTIRESAAALATPGAHPTQQTFDLLQTAHGYADLGNKEKARQFLDEAADLATCAGEPPPAVYWYIEPFFRLNIGVAQLGIGEFADAAESLKRGIETIPAEQSDAEWMNEYREALAEAQGH